jgi:hypothetical protein
MRQIACIDLSEFTLAEFIDFIFNRDVPRANEERIWRWCLSDRGRSWRVCSDPEPGEGDSLSTGLEYGPALDRPMGLSM